MAIYFRPKIGNTMWLWENASRILGQPATIQEFGATNGEQYALVVEIDCFGFNSLAIVETDQDLLNLTDSRRKRWYRTLLPVMLDTS